MQKIPKIHFFFKSVARLVTLSSFLLSVACTTVRPDGSINGDPLEDINRPIFKFNQFIDTNALTPVARAYKTVTPEPIVDMVDNFFGNLGDVTSFVSNVLQLKAEGATEDFLRVSVNSTFGLLGVWDIASAIGIRKRGEDFGQALGYWGVGPGAYLMLPFLGPTTVRDGVGRTVDSLISPTTQLSASYQIPATALNVIHTRSKLLIFTDGQDSSDAYSFLRSFYLQKREYDVYDGEPPEEKETE